MLAIVPSGIKNACPRDKHFVALELRCLLNTNTLYTHPVLLVCIKYRTNYVLGFHLPQVVFRYRGTETDAITGGGESSYDHPCLVTRNYVYAVTAIPA